MPDDPRPALAAVEDLPEIVRKIRARTPARLLAGRSGAGYRTATQLDLREAHAAARDAVRAELETDQVLARSFGARGIRSTSAHRRRPKMNICSVPTAAVISIIRQSSK